MVEVVLKDITKRFGKVVAASDVSLKIDEGEFFTLLGPSGCGKTTTMRIIAGLEQPDKGRVYFDSKDITDAPPYKRNTGMVFQNYALWPHMSVFENVAYGLRVRKIPKVDVNKRVHEVLDLVKLGDLAGRFPSQLSGGQQQRVALARALVIEPEVLLLDEPLSNLDAKLRVEMREEIKELQKRLKITTIYVTHDQEEAMAVSDRMAIQNKGIIEQIGSPIEVYSRPRNILVATFLGQGVLLEGVVEKAEEPVRVRIGDLTLHGISSMKTEMREGDRVACVLRPENFTLEEPKAPSNVFEGVTEWTAFVGPHKEVKLNVGGVGLLVDVPSNVETVVGRRMRVYICQKDTIVLPLEAS